jgi:hypothetical protein
MTTSREASSSKQEIDSLTSDFFRTVSFFEGNKPAYQHLYQLFSESGQLIKNSSTLPEISTVRQFIESRQSMVDSGELTGFKEVETAEITEIFGNVTHRFSTYEKYGINKGAEFGGRGIISMQFIMTESGWKISSEVGDVQQLAGQFHSAYLTPLLESVLQSGTVILSMQTMPSRLNMLRERTKCRKKALRMFC